MKKVLLFCAAFVVLLMLLSGGDKSGSSSNPSMSFVSVAAEVDAVPESSTLPESSIAGESESGVSEEPAASGAGTFEPDIESSVIEDPAVSSDEQVEDSKEEYIFPDSNSRYLSEEEIGNVDTDKLRIARNEIFARHGYIFNDEELNQYFNSTSWYQGTVLSDEFNEDWVLNDFEKENIKLIKYVEESERRSPSQTGETFFDASVTGGYANITELAETLIENSADIIGEKVAFCGWGYYHDSNKIEICYFEGENGKPVVTAYYNPEKMPTMGKVEPFDMANTIVWGTVRGISDEHGIEIDLDAVNVTEQDLWFVDFYAQNYREIFDANEAKAADWGAELTLEGTVQTEDNGEHSLILDNGDKCVLWGAPSQELSSVGDIAIYESFEGLRVKVYGRLASIQPMLSVTYIAPVIQ